MQHLKIFIFTILVVGSFFYVQGVPADKQRNCSRRDLKRPLLCCGSIDVNENDCIVNGPLSTGVDVINSVPVSETSVTGFGPDKEYTFGTLAQALTDVTVESLTSALRLDTSEKGAKETNFVSVFTELLLGHSLNPKHGVINYETAMLFSELFTDLAPESMAALKTIIYVMMRLKEQQTDCTAESFQSFVKPALLAFYGHDHIDEESTQTWTNIFPCIYKATQGNAAAAKNIVTSLAHKDDDLKYLQNLEAKTQLELVQTIIRLLVEFVQRIQSISD